MANKTMSKKNQTALPSEQRTDKNIIEKILLYDNRNVNKSDILFLFSAYIASNPNFKYNRTYLTDTIDNFLSDMNKCKYKYNTILKIIIDINIGFNFLIILDGIPLKYDSRSKNIEIDNPNFDFRFDKIGEKNCTLKFEYKSIEQSYLLKIEYEEDQLQNELLQENLSSYLNKFKESIESYSSRN